MITDYFAQLAQERLDRVQYTLADYADRPCPNCARQRLCICHNNKHVCEKCHWCVEDGEYRNDD